jgi:hypothetical protein
MADIYSSPAFWLSALAGFILVELFVTALIVRFSSGSGPHRR